MKDRLYLIIPAYNEQDNVEALIREWYPVAEAVPDARLVVINDGSRDNTEVILRALAAQRPRLEVLTKENGGHGDTLLFGYRHAIAQGAEWIFQTDSDGQTKAEEFPPFWELRAQYDAILGNRVHRGDGASRKLVENVLCTLLRAIFGVKVPDANCPFRLMRAEKVAAYIARLPEHYNLPNVMLTVFFVKSGDRVLFRPVTFENRKAGKNSINVKKIVKIGLQGVRDFLKFRKEMV